MDIDKTLSELEAKLRKGEVTKEQARAYLKALTGKPATKSRVRVVTRIQVHYLCLLCGHEAITHQTIDSNIAHLQPTSITRKTCSKCVERLDRFTKETIIETLKAVLTYGDGIVPDSGLSPLMEKPDTDWEQVWMEAGCPKL